MFAFLYKNTYIVAAFEKLKLTYRHKARLVYTKKEKYTREFAFV